MGTLIPVWLDDSARLSGSLPAGGLSKEKGRSFKDAHELAATVGADAALVIGADRRPGERACEQLEAAFGYSSSGLWMAQDLAYLFSFEVPAGPADLPAFAESVEERLAALSPELLSQLAELASESLHSTRVGLFTWELHRRYDALSMPRGGNSSIDEFLPQERELSGVKRQEIAPDILELTLGARQAMAEAFSGYEERPEQQAMAQAVDKAFTERRSLVVEAGTGVGKSLAYLVPSAIHSARTGKLVLVSTNTLNLQQQLVDLDIPRLERILPMLELRVTLLKGREHYLCLKRLQETWLAPGAQAMRRRQDLEGDELPGLLFVMRMLLQTSESGEGDLDSIPTPKGLKPGVQSRLLRSVDCGFRTCLGDRCEFKPRCHYFNTRNRANVSHLVVTNHALVFSHFTPEQQDRDNVVARSETIVFDEAHNLESAITSQMTLEFSQPMMVDLGNRLLELLQSQALSRRLELPASSIPEQFHEMYLRCQSSRQQIGNWIRIGVEVRDQVNLLLAQAVQKGYLGGAMRHQLSLETASEQQRAIVELLAKLAARLAGVVEKYTSVAVELHTLFCTEESEMYLDDAQFQMEAQALRFETLSALGALQNWRPGDPGWITWFNCDLGDPETQWDFRTAPLNVGQVFQQLATQKESIVLSSATLTVANNFDYLRQSLGYNEESAARADWLQLESPFNYKEQSLLLVATDIAAPVGATRNRYLEQMEGLLHGVQKVFGGGVLVLFNSYRDLNHIAEALAPAFDPDELLVQGMSGTRAEIAEEFRRRGDRILLATRSFWEGFDVAGDALRCVVLAKLPFANISDPIHAGRQRALDQSGGDSFRDYSLPQAAMLLKQGFGRLIRGTKDYGCVFLLDSRVVTARYGSVFINSLPGPQLFSGSTSSCLDAAERFMAGHRAALESQHV